MANKDFVVKNSLIVGDTATINGVQLNPSGATSGQVLKFDGTKFAPASEGDISGTVYSATIGDGTNSSYVITHGFGTRNVVVVIRNAASPYEVIQARWEATTTNTITVDFSSPVTSDSIIVSVYGAVTGISTGSSYYQTIGNGTDSSFTLTHNFNTRDVVVTARNAASPYEVINARWEAETANTVVLDFSVAPSSSSVRVGVYATVSGTAVASIDDLSDVIITSSTTGDLLKWNGSAWVNAAGYATLASPTFTGNVSGITKTMVGLGLVDNTADSSKPVSTAQQTALDLKANLASPALTGTPTAPTATAATNTTQVATTAFVRAEVSALVNSAGSTLDTLGEIATALGNDANLSTTLTTSIGFKAPIASPTFTGTVTIPTGASITAPTGLVKGDVGLGNVDNTSNATERAATATLTNKTLTSPVVNTPTGIVKGDVGLGLVDNTADTTKPVSTAQQTALDLKANLASPTFTGTVITSNLTVNGSLKITTALEVASVSATAATGTINIDFLSNPVVYYTANATANWTLNVRGNSSTTMNAVMSTGDVATVTFMAQQGATAYYPTVYQIDGTTVTPKWQGGTAPTSGNASSIDTYAVTVVKTAANTYTAFASQTRFA